MAESYNVMAVPLPCLWWIKAYFEYTPVALAGSRSVSGMGGRPIGQGRSSDRLFRGVDGSDGKGRPLRPPFPLSLCA